MAEQWLTMAQYAKSHGISREAVRKAVKVGRIESNGKTGKDCRVKGPMAESVRIIVKDSPVGDLAEAKLEKLRADVALQQQKIRSNRIAFRREFSEAVIEEYLRAFAPVKTFLADLRLSAEKLTSLQTMIEKCTADFEVALRKRAEEDGCF